MRGTFFVDADLVDISRVSFVCRSSILFFGRGSGENYGYCGDCADTDSTDCWRLGD